MSIYSILLFMSIRIRGFESVWSDNGSCVIIKYIYVRVAIEEHSNTYNFIS